MVKIRPDEISSIIKQQIEQYQQEVKEILRSTNAKNSQELVKKKALLEELKQSLHLQKIDLLKASDSGGVYLQILGRVEGSIKTARSYKSTSNSVYVGCTPKPSKPRFWKRKN